MDNRKSIKVHEMVKAALADVKKQVGLKTESEAIYYLHMVNTWAMTNMPTGVYRTAIELAKDTHRDDFDLGAAIEKGRAAAKSEQDEIDDRNRREAADLIKRIDARLKETDQKS